MSTQNELKQGYTWACHLSFKYYKIIRLSHL